VWLIGATCANITPAYAFLVGIIGGAISVIGYAIIQPALQKMLKGIDTCGVHNLHGMPGIFGGLVAVLFVASKGNPGFRDCNYGSNSTHCRTHYRSDVDCVGKKDKSL